VNPFKAAYERQFGPRLTASDVSYGPHPKQVMHFWKTPQATADRPAPLLFFIHGGGWQGGDRMSGLTGMLPKLLTAGVSVVSAEYRFIKEAMDAGIEPPVKAPLSDAARALQTVRSRSAEWQIDKARIAASGGSAGACSSLWLAFHDDMADPTSADPVARESTRLLAAAVSGGIGLAASGNIDATGTNPSMFEPVHGSAPDIAGKGIADPTAAVMSVALLLSHIGEEAAAARIDRAVADHLATRGSAALSTAEVGRRIRDRL
jgi:hypothetical protein